MAAARRPDAHSIKAQPQPIRRAPASKTLCEGTARRWDGQSLPVCPVCKGTPKSLGVKRPKRLRGRWDSRVPPHDRPGAPRLEESAAAKRRDEERP